MIALENNVSFRAPNDGSHEGPGIGQEKIEEDAQLPDETVFVTGAKLKLLRTHLTEIPVREGLVAGNLIGLSLKKEISENNLVCSYDSYNTIRVEIDH